MAITSTSLASELLSSATTKIYTSSLNSVVSVMYFCNQGAATANLTTTGSLIVQGDIQVTGTIFDQGAPAATLADATALAIALGG